MAQAAFQARVIRPFLLAVYFKPFLLRTNSLESLKRSTRVQSMIRPAGNNVRGNTDAFECGRFGCPEGIEQGMLLGLGEEILHQV